MTESIKPSKQTTPEKAFNFISQNAPVGTKNLIRAMKSGLNAEKAKEYLNKTLPANTPPEVVKAFNEAISYIDQELQQGGFSLV